MDPFFIAAAGSAVLAVALRKRKPADTVSDETFCPPEPPPITSPEWVGIAQQATAIVGAGGAIAANIAAPGIGTAVGGAIALGQQIVGFGIEQFDQMTTGQKREARQRLINSCYGNPPGTIFRQYGGRKKLPFEVTLLDLFYVANGNKQFTAGFSTKKLKKVFQPSIPIADQVKYFVTTEGPPRCCAKRISPARAQQFGHKLYSEAETRAFYAKVKIRRERRLMQMRLNAAKASSDAAAAPEGTKGTGFLRSTAVVNTPPSGYKVPHRDEVPGKVAFCHPEHGHLDLFCHPTDPTKKCVWVIQRQPCYTGAEAEYRYG